MRSARTDGAGSLDPREIDESALGIGAEQFQTHVVTDVEPRSAALDPALRVRIQDPGPGPLLGRSRDDPLEGLADAGAQEACGR